MKQFHTSVPSQIWVLTGPCQILVLRPPDFGCGNRAFLIGPSRIWVLQSPFLQGPARFWCCIAGFWVWKSLFDMTKIRRLQHQNLARPYKQGDFNTQIWLRPVRKARFSHPKSGWCSTKIRLGPYQKRRWQHPKSGDCSIEIWLGPLGRGFPHPKSCDFTTKIWLGPIKKAVEIALPIGPSQISVLESGLFDRAKPDFGGEIAGFWVWKSGFSDRPQPDSGVEIGPC